MKKYILSSLFILAGLIATAQDPAPVTQHIFNPSPTFFHVENGSDTLIYSKSGSYWSNLARQYWVNKYFSQKADTNTRGNPVTYDYVKTHSNTVSNAYTDSLANALKTQAQTITAGWTFTNGLAANFSSINNGQGQISLYGPNLVAAGLAASTGSSIEFNIGGQMAFNNNYDYVFGLNSINAYEINSTGIENLVTGKYALFQGDAAYQSHCIYNVKDYGAVADGTTDNLAAVNAAIAAMPSTGGTLYFPAGNYYLSATITPNKNISIIGDGMNIGYLNFNTSSASPYFPAVSYTNIIFGGSSAPAFLVNNSTAFNISNIGFTYSGTPAAGNCAIRCTAGGQINVNAISTEGFYEAIRVESGTFEYNITNCHFNGCVYNGLFLDNSTFADHGDYVVAYCVFHPTGLANAAIYIQAGGGAKLIGNKINWRDPLSGSSNAFNYGIEVNNITGATSDLKVNGGSIENFRANGFYMAPGSYAFNNIQISAEFTPISLTTPIISLQGTSALGTISNCIFFGNFGSNPVVSLGGSITSYVVGGNSYNPNSLNPVLSLNYTDQVYDWLQNAFLNVGGASALGHFTVSRPTNGIGIITVTAGGTTVTAVRSFFTTSYKVGDLITANGETHTISAIASNTSMTTDAWTNAYTGNYTDVAQTPFSVADNGNVALPLLTANGLLGTGAGKQLSVITALPAGTTATTQAANDNSTKIQTTAGSELINFQHTIFTPATGATVTLVNHQYNVINPSGSLAALTFAMPASPVNGDVVFIKFIQNVTAVTWPASVKGAAASGTADNKVTLLYDSASGYWY